MVECSADVDREQGVPGRVVVGVVRAQALEGAGADEKAQFLALLARIVGNLEAMLAEDEERASSPMEAMKDEMAGS